MNYIQYTPTPNLLFNGTLYLSELLVLTNSIPNFNYPLILKSMCARFNIPG